MAQANVAAVSYHFGSLKSLCDAAVEYALERYLASQEEEISTLGGDASLEDLAAAFVRPMARALAVGGRELDVMSTVSLTPSEKELRRREPTSIEPTRRSARPSPGRAA